MNRIAAAALLAILVALPAFAADDGTAGETTTKVYDVGFLTRGVLDREYKPLGLLQGEGYMDEPPMIEIESEGGLDISTVMAMIQGVDEDWEHPASIESTERYIIVVHRKAVHLKIEALLMALRAKVGTTITCTFRAYRAVGAVDLAAGGSFEGKAGEELLAKLVGEGKLVLARSWTLTGFNGQQVASWEGTERPYVRDFDVEVAQDSAIADPIMGTIREGFSFAVRPSLAPPGQIVVDLKASMARLEGEVGEKETKAEMVGSLDVPRMRMLEIETTLFIPDGGIALVGSLCPAPAGGEGAAHEERTVLVVGVKAKEGGAK